MRIRKLLLFAQSSSNSLHLPPQVQGKPRLENQQQCQRLCWYWKTCGRYSFYSKNDNRADNCVLHKGRRNHGEEKLVDDWIDEEPSGRNL
ncbi:hypothetical protein ACOMHN_040853 [Nucella lapillus]